jgi:hypothetical protein
VKAKKKAVTAALKPADDKSDKAAAAEKMKEKD